MRRIPLLAVLAILFAGCSAAYEPEQITRRLMEMWETGTTTDLERITTEDVVYEDLPNGVRFDGRDGIRRYIEHVHAWAGEVELSVTAVHSGSNSAVAEWVMRGIQDRPIPGRIPVATNRPFELRGATLVELREGKIARAADYLDVLGFVIQLGARVELPGGVVIPPVRRDPQVRGVIPDATAVRRGGRRPPA